MAGKGTISVNQVPQYGDKTKLENLKKNLTKTPVTGVQYEAPTAGRPVSTGAGLQQPAPQQAPQRAVPPDQQELMRQYAQAFRTNQFWQGVMAQYPSEFSKMYADEAATVFNNLQNRLRNATPFFE